MTPTTRTPATLALDIGGANTKAARLEGSSLRTVSRPFEVWRDREALTAVLREVAAEAGEADAVAITMTAELSDAFRTKREGVAFVLDAAEEALGDRPLSVLTTTGELVPMGEARARPWDVAAANWMATALAVADAYPDALLIDVGSTTADVIPIAAGRVAATGHNDLERLLAGRARLHRRAPHEPRRDRAARADPRRLVPGRVGVLRDQRRRPSRPRPSRAGGVRLPHARRPPGRDRLRARAHRQAGVLRRRPARGATRSTRSPPSSTASSCARSRKRRAASSASARAPVVAVGAGAFLAREVAARLGRAVAPAPWGSTAAALAALLAARLC